VTEEEGGVLNTFPNAGRRAVEESNWGGRIFFRNGHVGHVWGRRGDRSIRKHSKAGWCEKEYDLSLWMVDERMGGKKKHTLTYTPRKKVYTAENSLGLTLASTEERVLR